MLEPSFPKTVPAFFFFQRRKTAVQHFSRAETCAFEYFFLNLQP